MDDDRTPPSIPRRITKQRAYDVEDYRRLAKGEVRHRLEEAVTQVRVRFSALQVEGYPISGKLADELAAAVRNILVGEDDDHHSELEAKIEAVVEVYLTMCWDAGRRAAEHG